MSPTLDIYLLSDFHLEHDGVPVTTVSTPRLQSLLTYLVLHRNAPQARHHLAFLLWPDSAEAQARTNLRNLLHHLRRALPDADRFLNANGQILQWLPDAPFRLDVADFESASAQVEQTKGQAALRKALEKAVALYRGDLLPSCYDDWILPQRERLRQTFLRTLEHLIDLLEDERRYSEAIGYAQRLLREDPLSEATYRRLMRLHALNGDRAGALRVYHTCATTLQRELDMAPSPATREAYERQLKLERTPEAPRAETVPVPPLVGRDRVWSQLREAWRTATAEGPLAVLLTGEAGIGKTRLAEELIEWANRQGVATGSARCYATEGPLAYAPVATWLRARPLPPLDDVWLTEVARLSPDLLVERSDLAEPRSLTEAWQRQRLFEALARAVLGRKQPLMLLLDDLQWCDHESLVWLHYLLRFDPRARLLIVGTLRPEEMVVNQPLASLLTALRHNEQLIEIELEPLDRTETAALAEHLADRRLEPALASLLYQETEGNPLFVVETVRAGLPSNHRGPPPGPRSPIVSLLTLLPKVQAVIAARLEKLSPPACDLVSLAATIGREFTFAVLAEASDCDEDTLVQGLDELWQRRVLREQGTDAYDFAHDKIREMAYASLSTARRRLLHRRVAQALEKTHASDPDTVSGRIAVHYEQANQPERASLYYQRAAEAAQRMYANEAAIGHFQRALALLPESTEVDQAARQVAICEQLGQVLRRQARYAEAEKAYRAMQEAAAAVGDRGTQARAWNRLSEVNESRNAHREALKSAEQAEELARAAGAQEELAMALFGKGWAFYRLGNAEAALALGEQALALSTDLDARHVMARSQNLLGVVHKRLGNHKLSLRYQAKALSLFRQLGDQRRVAGMLNNLGETARLCNDYATAIPLYQKAIAMAQEIGDRDWEIVFLGNLGAAQVGRREYGPAEDSLRQAICMAEMTGETRLSETYRFLAEAYLGQGKVTEALATARQALATGQETSQRVFVGGAWLILGMVAAQSRQPVSVGNDAYDARACYAESLRILTETGAEFERAHALRAWAEYEREQGDKGRGEKMWHEVQELGARLGIKKT